MTRQTLPNKRRSETVEFTRDGSQYRMTVGYYPDGRPGEIFLNADRHNSALDVLMSDAAIAISHALQRGATLDELRHSFKRDKLGLALSPICAALDQIGGAE